MVNYLRQPHETQENDQTLSWTTVVDPCSAEEVVSVHKKNQRLILEATMRLPRTGTVTSGCAFSHFSISSNSFVLAGTTGGTGGACVGAAGWPSLVEANASKSVLDSVLACPADVSKPKKHIISSLVLSSGAKFPEGLLA